jgi:hypothetical protein
MRLRCSHTAAERDRVPDLHQGQLHARQGAQQLQLQGQANISTQTGLMFSRHTKKGSS